MKFNELKKLPNFMLGFMFGLAMSHAKEAVNNLYPDESDEIKNAHIERFTNLLLEDYATSPNKIRRKR